MDKVLQRPLLSGNIRQRTENGFLCLTDLLSIYESERIHNGWIEKRIDHFFLRDSNVEYLIELLDIQGVFMNVQKHTFTELLENQGIIKALKSISKYQTKGRGENKAVFCDPYIFVAVAQWLNPRFRAYVTIWVTDSLILNRIEAGAEYNKLCQAINDYILPELSDNGKKFIYSNFAKLLNKAVFKEHREDLRQFASKDQLSELKRLETKLVTLIEVGYIKTYQDAKEYLNQNN